MALNIPNTSSGIDTLLKGVDTGSGMFARLMQPVVQREQLAQQQNQFIQNLALQKQAQNRAQALLPYMIQQYQDAHKTAQSEADFKNIYRNVIKDAFNPNVQTATSPQLTAQTAQAPVSGNPVNIAPPVPGAGGETPIPGVTPTVANPIATTAGVMPQGASPQEQELRAGNPRLTKLDAIAGLVPGIPKPDQKVSNGMIITTYPSGRVTVQQISGSAGQTPGERNVTAKEASKLRDQATALVNSANLVQQGYDLLDNNEDLTGIGSGLSSKFNLSDDPALGQFTAVTGKLQAELGKYAASRGGIQAVNWASSVKPSSWKPEDYNYGMFEGIQKNLKDDYETLNTQYKAATGQDLPVPLPPMTRKDKSGKSSTTTGSTGEKVKKKWKFVNGELV